MSDENKDLYKNTVFLPKTEFPMRGGLPQKEPEILEKWQSINLYKKLREQSKDKEKWILHDGPPYANGNIHIGHAMNKILKDVVVRFYQMIGYNAPFVPGWDCHGLPIEWKIEEKYREQGKSKDDVAPLQFREECREFARKWVDIQSEQFQRLGVLGDWDNPYLTMKNKAEGKIAKEIHKFVKNKGLYRGVKPVMWSTVEQTALAEAEIEYKEHKSVTIWIKFPVIQTNLEAIKDTSIIIWTTTPWTMPSNRAIAFGKDMEYGVYKIKKVAEESRAKENDVIVLSTALAETVKESAKIEEWDTLHRFMGGELEGTVCSHPFRGKGYDFDVPLLEGDFVTDEAGTGFVHVAPGHGADDFYLGQKHGIEITDNVTDDGKFREHVPLFSGLEVYTQTGKMGDGNFTVIKEMDQCGALLNKGSLRHEYPHSWRSKAPVIFRTTPQWFIGMDQNNLREKALNAISETRWVPEKGEARIRAMIEQRPDWCISRQRAWGVPIALFVHKESKEILDDDEVLSRIGNIFEEEGSDAWWSRPAQDFLGNAYDQDDYDQIFDIVDVWFESGATHAFVIGDTETWPDHEGVAQSDLYLEGSDQHRGWFHSSLLESCGTTGNAPYKTVLTHGFVLDEKGYKMSKSLGNVVDPQKMIGQYGADILRLWTMTSDYAEDIKIGQDMLKSTTDLYRRIRNTFRFLLGALEGFSEQEAIFDLKDWSLKENKNLQDLPELEQYMLSRLLKMDEEIKNHILNYEFTKLSNKLHHFCNNELSAFYFDIRKDRLYCDAPNLFERRACRSVLAIILRALTAWFAPVLSFTTEEVWSYRPKDVFEDLESIHLFEFPNFPEEWENNVLEEKWQSIIALRKDVLAAIEPLRANKELGSSLEAAPTIVLSEEKMNIFKSIDFSEVCITGPVIYQNGDTKIAIEKAKGEKCERCWKVLPEVSETKETLCNRCSKAVDDIKNKEAA
jgi:isoleucyl-tRNA synthetase